MKNIVLIASMILTLACGAAFAQTTEFTYQGNLKNGAAPAAGNYDFEFALFDAVAGGAQVGGTLPRNSVAVADGIFSVKLNFGDQFPGSNRFLEIRVRPTGGGAFTTLNPRPAITSSPYAVTSLFSVNAGQASNASNALQLGGVAAGQYVLTGDVRLSDSRTPLSNSSFYVQNTTTQQVGSNFNIGGNGTVGGTLTGNAVNANVVNAVNQYNIGGIRALSILGSSNLFAGENTGFSNTTGGNNSFVGSGAGFTNSLGGDNSFFGTSAGQNSTGSGNSFFGMNSGTSNTLGSNNTLIGKLANVSTGNLTNVTAIGANSLVSQSNSLVLGNGVNVGIGTTAPSFKLHVVGENIRVEGNTTGIFPRFSLNFTGGAVDAKRWQNYASPNALVFSALNDTDSIETIWLQVVRAGTAISSINFLNGTVAISNLGAAGSTSLCRNASNQISTCTAGNLSEKNAQNTELQTQITKQQTQIEAQQKQIDEQKEVIKKQQEKSDQQQTAIDALKQLVCSQNPSAKICIVKEQKP